MAGTERDQIEKLLSGIGIDAFSSLGATESMWDVDQINADDKSQEYEISHGLVKFGAEIDKKTLIPTFNLQWHADVPDYLKPGGSFEAFTDFVFGEFPSILNSDERAIPKIRQSHIALSACGLYRHGSGQIEFYSGFVAGELGKFSDLFENQADNLRRVYALINQTPGVSYETALMVADYRQGWRVTDIALTLPLRADKQRRLNPNTMEWILGTHTERNKVPDVRNAAFDLSSQVTTIFESSLR